MRACVRQNELCRQHGVDRLFVFGSVLRPDYQPGLSDLDFLVDFQPMPPVRKAHAFFGMRDALHHLLGAEVDLVMAGAVRNPIIAREIAATCQQIYGM
ncbi:nucleotidyltransferase domain-containing protein [Cyanobium sp. Alchichica 3B3-8F6]|uniref:nucleotidyltransferase family protein n=1 Tax=Cyanobium sp. Alchichica 3B3-8F6 TaxID=2823696 RepID=UPI0020CF2ED1|nr:nucleotidyltransferase domain-containing protein [Cyanobium sp. Alchichica 3B3-8F6]MCP9882347.1 nucleotidyltransferase domain-containing protein [Cyanobium sp. Alchichica 3B3-8F6]